MSLTKEDRVALLKDYIIDLENDLSECNEHLDELMEQQLSLEVEIQDKKEELAELEF